MEPVSFTILTFLAAAAGAIVRALLLGLLAGAIVYGLLRALRKRAGWGWIVLVFFLVAPLAFAGLALPEAYTPVERGTVGVVVRQGSVTGEVLSPGVHWRVPYVDQIVVVRTVILAYETSYTPGSSKAAYPDYPVAAQTIDGQEVQVQFTVLFHVAPERAAEVVRDIGFMQEVVENVVKARSRNLSRLLLQRYTADELRTQEGVLAYEASVREELESALDPYGIILADFLVREIDFEE